MCTYFTGARKDPLLNLPTPELCSFGMDSRSFSLKSFSGDFFPQKSASNWLRATGILSQASFFKHHKRHWLLERWCVLLSPKARHTIQKSREVTSGFIHRMTGKEIFYIYSLTKAWAKLHLFSERSHLFCCGLIRADGLLYLEKILYFEKTLMGIETLKGNFEQCINHCTQLEAASTGIFFFNDIVLEMK